MKYEYLSDSHVHSIHSEDASDAVEVLCEAAIRIGLKAITITDHFECNEIKTARDLEEIKSSVLNTQKAATIFRDRIKVYRGVEIGQPNQNPLAAQTLLEEVDFDFVLGSIHNIKGRPDFYYLDYKNEKIDYLLRQYFEELKEVVDQGFVDSMAHLTYPLRYIVGKHKIPVEYDDYMDQIKEVLQMIIDKEMALEVNSSGLRHNIAETLPPPFIVKEFMKMGGKFVTVGSDSHRWGDLGSGLEQTMEMLKNIGLTEFTVYEERKPHFKPIA